MKTRKPKPRRMWANHYDRGAACFLTKKAALKDDATCMFPVAFSVAVPVAVIPLDDIPALVKSARAAFFADNSGHGVVAALTAIGVLPKSRKQGGRK